MARARHEEYDKPWPAGILFAVIDSRFARKPLQFAACRHAAAVLAGRRRRLPPDSDALPPMLNLPIRLLLAALLLAAFLALTA